MLRLVVPTVRFANQNKDLLCFASMDGGITVTSAAGRPAVIKRLRDHTRGVTGAATDHVFLHAS